MRRNLLITFMMFAMCTLGMAQTVVFSDNFDSYTAGSHLAQTNPAWTTWNDLPGSAEDGVISNAQAVSAPNSLYVSGSVDQIYPFGNYYTGHYTVSFNMLVPSTGDGAYFNVQHRIKYQWAFACYFYNNGTGYLRVGNIDFNFTYPSNSWFPVVMDVDLDQNVASLSVNDTVVNTWPFHYTENDTLGELQLAAIDLYAGAPDPNASGTYYVDDFTVTEVNAALVGKFEVTPDTLQANMAPDDSCTLNLRLTNPGTMHTNYRIVPTYDIPNPDMTSTGASVLRYCSDTIQSSWGYYNATEYDIAIYFPSSELQSHIGKTLQTISVVMTDQITNAKIRVYDMGNSFWSTGPGDVLYEQSFSPVNGWNHVSLNTPFVLDGRDLWVGVWIDQPDSIYPIFFDNHIQNGYSSWVRKNNTWYTYIIEFPFSHMIMAQIDGTPINPWLNVDPAAGIVNIAGWPSDTANVDVKINTEGMGYGETHSAKLHCYSSDFDNKEVVVPVYLNITNVSVNEHNQIEVALYPNPATDFVQITSDQILSVKVFNLSGQLMHYGTYHDSRVIIPTTNFTAGTYLVEVTTKGGRTTKKVVVR